MDSVDLAEVGVIGNIGRGCFRPEADFANKSNKSVPYRCFDIDARTVSKLSSRTCDSCLRSASVSGLVARASTH
jgi:hypothetical protein